jgi:hypothetical protein
MIAGRFPEMPSPIPSWVSVANFTSSNENDEIWEPINQEILAQHDIRVPKYRLDDLDIDTDSDTESNGNARSEDLGETEHTDAQRAPTRVDWLKWEYIRDPIIPEPREFREVQYKPTTTIREKFRESGLQVIVKMVSIELTPRNQSFPWEVGM